MSEISNTVLQSTNTDYSNDFKLGERRVHPRFKTTVRIWIEVPNVTGKRKFNQFNALNISHVGVCIDSKAFPFKKDDKYNLVLLLTINEKVTRIYLMIGYVRHTKPGSTGFMFVRKNDHV